MGNGLPNSSTRASAAWRPLHRGSSVGLLTRSLGPAGCTDSAASGQRAAPQGRLRQNRPPRNIERLGPWDLWPGGTGHTRCAPGITFKCGVAAFTNDRTLPSLSRAKRVRWNPESSGVVTEARIENRRVDAEVLPKRLSFEELHTERVRCDRSFRARTVAKCRWNFARIPRSRKGMALRTDSASLKTTVHRR